MRSLPFALKPAVGPGTEMKLIQGLILCIYSGGFECVIVLLMTPIMSWKKMTLEKIDVD